MKANYQLFSNTLCNIERDGEKLENYNKSNRQSTSSPLKKKRADDRKQNSCEKTSKCEKTLENDSLTFNQLNQQKGKKTVQTTLTKYFKDYKLKSKKLLRRQPLNFKRGFKRLKIENFFATQRRAKKYNLFEQIRIDELRAKLQQYLTPEQFASMPQFTEPTQKEMMNDQLPDECRLNYINALELLVKGLSLSRIEDGHRVHRTKPIEVKRLIFLINFLTLSS